eukprot:Hpha_TRINITY_DN10807_c0_g3::TRINITY_DN10807_c0_g3_i1::g.23390::m.23390
MMRKGAKEMVPSASRGDFEGTIAQAIGVAQTHSSFTALAPEYKRLFRELWIKWAGHSLVIQPHAAKQFAGDMVARGWTDWKLSAKDISMLDRFGDVGGMSCVAFAEFSENDSFDADAHFAERMSKCGEATGAHTDWLQQGGPAALAASDEVGVHATVTVDWSSPPGQRAKQLVEALRRDGVCVLVNHSHPRAQEQGVRLAGDLFRARAQWTRPQVAEMQSDFRDRPMMKTAVGYTDLRQEQLNQFQPADLKQTFDYADSVPSSPDVSQHMGNPIWPQERKARIPLGEVPVGFKEACLDFLKTQRSLSEQIVAVISQGLGLSGDELSHKFKDPLVVGRLISYPPQSSAVVPGEMGAGSHVDYGAVTLIVEGSAGLQMHDRETSQWLRIPHIPGGIIVQTGYAMEKLTNGYLKAARHRVRNDTGAERKSAVVFYDPTPTVQIGPHPHFITPEQPVKYEACIAGKKGVRFGDPRYLTRAAAAS